MHEIKDITIIGGGPTGLFASFYAGMRGATAQIVDTLPQLGGQLTALYPEKYIFDVAGFRQVLAKDLVRDLTDQAAQFNFPSYLGQHVMGLEEEDFAWRLREAWSAARSATSPLDLLCITVSVFLAGELRPLLTLRSP